MSYPKKERVRITLNVDRELYEKVKALSGMKGKPISRLFDEVFTSAVEQYSLSPKELDDLKVEELLKHHEEFQELKKSMPNFDPIEYHEAQLRKMEVEHKEFLENLKQVLDKNK